ncbi:MAG: prepilin-type N-terminal cleavage/methylation domain-containing protein [Actinobacteria bacterium]|nr:prepilin-type N-terminal cleavage/methylation domain-containing protein [Actinomycetota bacterium]
MVTLIRRLRREDGMTLAELLVTMMLMGIVAAMFSSILASVQGGIGRETDRSNDNDQVRLAIQQLDKDIRSGNLLYNPGVETDPYYSMRLYTQSFAELHTPPQRCIQWKLVGTDLQRRQWGVNWTSDPVHAPTPWRTVATDVVNRTVPASENGGNPTYLFRLDPDLAKGSRTLIIQVLTQTSEESGNWVKVEASITGRNTSYGYPVNVCATLPPG